MLFWWYIGSSYIGKYYALVKDSSEEIGICSYYEFYDSDEKIKYKLNHESANLLSEAIFQINVWFLEKNN